MYTGVYKNEDFRSSGLVMVAAGDDFNRLIIVEVHQAVFHGNSSAPESAEIVF